MNAPLRRSRLALPLAALAALGLGPVLAQPAPVPLKFKELYSSLSLDGVELSPKVLEADGKRVEMVGYMAPPLRPRINFFVLTRDPMSVCPFCASAAEWPADIVLVILPKPRERVSEQVPLRVRGRLELGVKEDPETGFVSLIRVYADEISPLPR